MRQQRPEQAVVLWGKAAEILRAMPKVGGKRLPGLGQPNRWCVSVWLIVVVEKQSVMHTSTSFGLRQATDQSFLRPQPLFSAILEAG